MITRQNNLENLQLDLELNSGYEVNNDEGLAEHLKKMDEIVSRQKIIICGELADGALEDCSYLWIDPSYNGELSPGQRQTYEILLSLQSAAIYSMTTIGKLAKMMGLDWSLACGKRLENLQSLGAINGLK